MCLCSSGGNRQIHTTCGVFHGTFVPVQGYAVPPNTKNWQKVSVTLWIIYLYSKTPKGPGMIPRRLSGWVEQTLRGMLPPYNVMSDCSSITFCVHIVCRYITAYYRAAQMKILHILVKPFLYYQGNVRGVKHKLIGCKCLKNSTQDLHFLLT